MTFLSNIIHEMIDCSSYFVFNRCYIAVAEKNREKDLRLLWN